MSVVTCPIRPIAADSLAYMNLFMKVLWTAALFVDHWTEIGANFLSAEDIEELVRFCDKSSR